MCVSRERPVSPDSLHILGHIALRPSACLRPPPFQPPGNDLDVIRRERHEEMKRASRQYTQILASRAASCTSATNRWHFKVLFDSFGEFQGAHGPNMHADTCLKHTNYLAIKPLRGAHGVNLLPTYIKVIGVNDILSGSEVALDFVQQVTVVIASRLVRNTAVSVLQHRTALSQPLALGLGVRI